MQCLLPYKVLLAIIILIWSNKRGGVRTIALQLGCLATEGCRAGVPWTLGVPWTIGVHEQPPWLFGAGAEHSTLPGRPWVPAARWATRYRLYLQKLVDFPPQLNRLTASEIGFEFLVWTNQWTTRKTTKITTKEMVSECYLKNHSFKRKICSEKDTWSKAREEVPPTVHRSVQNHKTLR